MFVVAVVIALDPPQIICVFLMCCDLNEPNGARFMDSQNISIT